MTCQSLRDVRFSVLELFSKMYHSKLHRLYIDRKQTWRSEFILAMSKLFVSLKLHLFSLLLTYCLFRPQNHKVNRRFHVRDICFSAVAFMSRTVKKNLKFKLISVKRRLLTADQR